MSTHADTTYTTIAAAYVHAVFSCFVVDCCVLCISVYFLFSLRSWSVHGADRRRAARSRGFMARRPSTTSPAMRQLADSRFETAAEATVSQPTRGAEPSPSARWYGSATTISYQMNTNTRRRKKQPQQSTRAYDTRPRLLAAARSGTVPRAGVCGRRPGLRELRREDLSQRLVALARLVSFLLLVIISLVISISHQLLVLVSLSLLLLVSLLLVVVAVSL